MSLCIAQANLDTTLGLDCPRVPQESAHGLASFAVRLSRLLVCFCGLNPGVQALDTEANLIALRINNEPRPGQEIVWNSTEHMILISNALL